MIMGSGEMLNEQFVLKMMEPYLNSKRELSRFEFVEIFSELDRSEQLEVAGIILKNGISVVEEKEEDLKEFENVPILDTPDNEHKYHHLMHLTNEQLCVMYQNGETSALGALLEKNKRFVYKMAVKVNREYRPASLTMDDLYMEGNLGMIEAAKRFDVSLDFKFTTYSWHWVRQKMERAIMDTGYMIRLPVHMFEKLIKLNNCRKRHSNATPEELLEYLSVEGGLKLTREELVKLLVYSDIYTSTTSLNDVVGENESTERIEFIPDPTMNTEEIVINERLKDELKRVMSTLTKRERKIIDLRFGLTTGSGMTLEQVGKEFNVTRERIRQIEAKALRKLRHPSRARKLKDYYS